jgi:hypothetical protein
MGAKLLGSRVSIIMTLVAGLALAAGDVPSLQAKTLARGPYSSMHMLLEKTFLKVDVAKIDVRFDKQTQARFAKLAKGKTYSKALGQELAKAAIGADTAVVQLKFLRDVSLDQWVDGVRQSLEKASRAGLITNELRQRVSVGLPVWFQAIKERGFSEGDRLLYGIGPEALRTVIVSHDGKVLVDRSDTGADKPRMVLATYFAPDTDYREPLLESLLKRAD